MTDKNDSTPSEKVYMSSNPFRPLEHTRPNRESLTGNNIVLVNQIIREVADWASQFREAEDGTNLCNAMDDLKYLMTTGWTEVDESLTRLILVEHYLKKKEDINSGLVYIGHAKEMLNRWQGRGGRIGNVE